MYYLEGQAVGECFPRETFVLWGSNIQPQGVCKMNDCDAETFTGTSIYIFSNAKNKI